MTPISEQLWKDCFGDGDDAPRMPFGCTYWQFAAAREALWSTEGMDWSTAYIAQLQRLKTLPNMEAYQEELDELIKNEMEGMKGL